MAAPFFPSTRALAFDAFGTLFTLRDPRHPYGAIAQHAKAQGHAPDDVRRRMMTTPLSLNEAFEAFHYPEHDRVRLVDDLRLELDSVEPMPGAIAMLRDVLDRGFRVAVVSNLAAPYAQPLDAWLPPEVVRIWSFEIGSIKPDPSIYLAAEQGLHATSSEVLMVGDTYAADVAGPRSQGWSALWFVPRHGPRSHSSPPARLGEPLLESWPALLDMVPRNP